MKIRFAAMLFASFVPVAAPASTLHGRVKDQQCSVLSQVIVRLHSMNVTRDVERIATTDDGGNYMVDLPPGAYQLCVKRDAGATPFCTDIQVTGTGDTWITTQMRDIAPALIDLGSRTK